MSWRILRIIALLLSAAAVMVLSLLPEPPISFKEFAGMDKVQHWVAYALLGSLVFATVQRRGQSLLLSFTVTVFVCTMYGGLIEVLQGLTGRNPDVMDFLVNMFGAAAGAVFALGLFEASRDEHRR